MDKEKLSKLFTPKQMQVIDEECQNSHWKLMINHGAVRSGKTFVDNFVFLMEVKHAAELAKEKDIRFPQYILAGVSSKSIQNNILIEISNTFGITFNFDKHNSFKIQFPNLPAVTIVQTFTGSISGLGAIRGMTSTGAYINEATMANEQVFDEIRKRCSATGARIVCDTNPDVPTHWLKKKYIDQAAKKDTIVVNHFTIDDNTYLDPEYVANMKATEPDGMFYDRSILGLWVAGEGLVYRDFDEKTMVIDQSKIPNGLDYYAGVDWGYEHACSIVVLGDDSNGNTYVVEEHTAQFEEIDHWVDVAKGIQRKYGQHIKFYADSARPEHVARFKRESINTMFGNKSVLSGIEMVSKLIKAKKLFVSKQGQEQLIDELYAYIWDEKTGEPVKENDHGLDAIRYAIYTRNYKPNVIKTFKW